MKSVQFAPIRLHKQENLQSVRAQGPALREFASRQTRDRPLLVAGSLVAIGMIPLAAYASRKVFGRPHPMSIERELPRNQEWYPWE